MTHKLKIIPMYFDAVEDGRKPFEVRKNDRDYSVGDTLILQEFEQGTGYSGKEITRTISFILDDSEYCKDGFVVIGLS